MRPFILYSILATTALSVVDANTINARARSVVTTNVADASGQTFDYIVVGGGLTGLAVAQRLAEAGTKTVLVIEAGADNRKDNVVQSIYTYGQALGTALDWSYATESGKSISAGKTLGGGSSINGATWTRGHSSQYDAWGSLLEPSEASLNWNWNGLFSYMKKAETFADPTDQQRTRGAGSNTDYHGYNGPVHAGFPQQMYSGPQQGSFIQSITSITNITLSPDLNGGQPNCVSYVPHSIEKNDADHRSTSASSYLTPVEFTRPTWLTLVGYTVTNLLWGNTTSAKKSVSGVSFKSGSNGNTYTAYAKLEVIMAAGAIATPAILQRSGVGDSALLGPLGITTVIDLKTVGKNLQEQTKNGITVSSTTFDRGGDGPSDVIAYPNIYQLFNSSAPSVISSIYSSLGTWATSQAGNALSADALKQIYNIQTDLIVNQQAPVLEMFFITSSPDSLFAEVWNLLPYSRGSVKITSPDPFINPQTTVNYFSVDLDLKIQVAGAKLSRKVFKTAPLSSLATGETSPGSAVPDDANGGTDASWSSWTRDNFNAVSHPIGTCAMMKRSLGGVVDGHLLVYDSLNLRVVDASIMPLQISGHLSSTLYGIAEKAADLILNSNSDTPTTTADPNSGSLPNSSGSSNSSGSPNTGTTTASGSHNSSSTLRRPALLDLLTLLAFYGPVILVTML